MEVTREKKAERWHRQFSEAWKTPLSIMENHVQILEWLLDLKSLDYLSSIIVWH